MDAALDSLYQEIILDHYKHPHHAGLRDPFEAEVHHVNPTCGDEVTLRVHVSEGTVTDVSYDAVGCSISQASTSDGTPVHPHDVSQLLDSRGIAVRGGHHCARPLHDRFGIQSSTRASFYLYTTQREIDALIDGLDYVRDFFGGGR